ncbi:MAG: hypothetical protein FWF43_02725 [Propionibacteriaceae bacterium]|nr:hypothetical protein [Propionibacteriaceae bacterium]
MRRIVLDANVLIAVLSHDDAHHATADSFIRGAIINGDAMCLPQLTTQGTPTEWGDFAFNALTG